MTEWIPCGDGFIEADVIRWKEGVWERRGPRQGGRAIKIGDRLVIAEVLREAEEKGWVYLLCRGCEVVSVKMGRKVALVKKGEELRRKRTTIARGRPGRLAWSDESVRARLVGKCAGDRKPVYSTFWDAEEN